ncbi:MAG: M67 family metallopeptidase [Synechococcaceae cyanobacterium]|nr:M67 family metallopeptidase [Synechococcaceae cyanobacterium]
MVSETPAEIRIRAQVLTVLRAVMLAAAPEEGCALLLGRRCTGPWSFSRLWPCLNVWEPARQRRRRFAIDPREQLQAQRWARRHGDELLGSVHSHPASPPRPSRCDRALTAAPALMLILGGELQAGRLELACWWLPEPPVPGRPGGGEPRPLVWTMEDPGPSATDPCSLPTPAVFSSAPTSWPASHGI